MIRRVDLAPQYLAHRDAVDDAIGRVLASGRYTLGPEVEAFEREFAAYLGVSHVVGVADGTRAIVLALRAFGVGVGHEVITTAFTAIPTIGAILETGATPVFADIDPETFLIDIDSILAAVTDRTRAVVPVHIFGSVFDVPTLRRRLADDIAIVEDAAQAHGARLGDRRAGSLGDAATFSFYPTKNLGGYGDGGAVVCRDAETASRLRRLRNHGLQDKDICAEPGVNCRLDELQAAVLRAKLPHLDSMNAARARIAARYIAELPATRFQPQRIPDGVTTNWHLFETRFRGDRDALVRHLDGLNIQTNVYYVIPHHLQPGLAHLGWRPGDLPHTEAVCRDAIALPLYPELSDEDVGRVVAAVRDYCRTAS